MFSANDISSLLNRKVTYYAPSKPFTDVILTQHYYHVN